MNNLNAHARRGIFCITLPKIPRSHGRGWLGTHLPWYWVVEGQFDMLEDEMNSLATKCMHTIMPPLVTMSERVTE